MSRRMPHALLAWELGDGLGHVGRLLPLADRLAAEGFAPIFALRDPALAGRRATARGYPVLQAPLAAPRRAAGTAFFARGFADILALIGFEDAAHLGAMVGTWRSLVELVAPALVIGDFSPTLALAMAGQHAPLLQVGSGFALPPRDLDRYPMINAAGTALADPERLARAVAASLPSGATCRPEDLPTVLGGDWQAACTWPLLDPYRASRNPAAIGPMAPTPAPRPDGARSGWFAYLAADAPRIDSIITGLLRSRARGAAFVRGAGDGLRRRFAEAGHHLHDAPPPLTAALADVAVVVHHGGINTAETALALGVPQLVVSRHLEQHLTGAAIAAAKAGRCLRGRLTPEQVTAALDSLIADETTACTALRLARSLGDRRGAVDTVIATALARVPRPKAGAA
jgi:rhamnosyltransferase subunit B